MKLKDLAHARAGDKGNMANISIIPFKEADYWRLKEVLTEQKVKEYFNEICKGSVTRYDLDSLTSFNFVLEQSLDGGVTRSLAIDKHGKALGMALLEMEI
jgi:hypothetical protein